MKPFLKGSLRRRLPAVFAAILVVSVGIYGYIAYGAAKEATLRSTRKRLEAIGTHAGSLIAAGFPPRVERLRGQAQRPALGEYLLLPDSANRTRALQAMSNGRGGGPGYSSTQLRNENGQVLLVMAPNGAETASPEIARQTAYDSLRLGPLYQVGDHVVYEIGAPIVRGGRVVGSLVNIRELGVNERTTDALLNFIGPEAGLFFGNSDGSIWTDLSGGPASPVPLSTRSDQYDRDGRSRIGRTVPMLGTPYLVAVDLPEVEVLAPVYALFSPLVLLATIVIAGGALTGWAMSRRITDPIGRLTAAAESVAAGYDEPGALDDKLASGRADEIGVLSRSFAVMARRVRESRETLEQQVQERTKELRAAQQELVVKERLATLGQLASGVGHELRNPLGVMNNAIYLLEAALASGSTKSKDYIQMLRAQIGLSEKIVSDLLDFARVKAPQRTSVALCELAEHQLGRLKLPATIQVVREIPEDLPLLHIDEVQIGQVVLNLITNAVQAMDGGNGTLTLRARVDGRAIRMDVSDSGPGIPPDNIEKVFEPLFTTKARGIGLGLSVSRSLAIANGAQLFAASSPGEGATFTLVLPLKEPG